MEGKIEYSQGGYSSKDYYETNHVKAGRSNYHCEWCNKTIPIGSPSATHKFYPEFEGPRTHVGKCEKEFIESINSLGEEKLEPITSEEQREIEREILSIFEGKEFKLYELIKSKNDEEFREVIVEDIINIMDCRWYHEGGKFKPFQISYKTKLKSQIILQIYKDYTAYYVKDKS